MIPARRAPRTTLGQAAELVIETQFGSTNMLARRLGLGHANAALLMTQLEENGVVGPPLHGRSRDVLVRPDQVTEVLNQIEPPTSAQEVPRG